MRRKGMGADGSDHRPAWLIKEAFLFFRIPTSRHKTDNALTELEMDEASRPVVTQEIRIVDEQGQTRLLLSAKGGTPKLQLLRSDGEFGSEVSLDADGRPAVKLANADPNGPAAVIEIDDKGAHVKFDGLGGASSYLFLNNAGGSGIVLFDSQGIRRLNAVIASDGSAKIERFGPDGKAVP
jgi:hypothetical protein